MESATNRGGGGGGGSSRVICTHFMRKGQIERDLWRAGYLYAARNTSPITVRGYHAWGVPYVRLMRRSPLAERLMYPIARSFAEEIGYVMGVRPQGSVGGKIVRLTLEPLSFFIGLWVTEQNWQALWHNQPNQPGVTA